jgi:hypothetical protein
MWGSKEISRSEWLKARATIQQRQVAAVLDHIVVGPGRRGFNKFDPARLAPVWRA